MSVQNVNDMKLMDAIGFTLTELDANREGYMSKRQRQRLSDVRGSWRNFGTLIKVMSPSLIVIAVVDGIRIGDTVSSRGGIVSLIVIITLIVLIYVHFKWRGFERDLLKGDVASVNGGVKRIENRQRNGMQYKIRIERTRFDVPWRVFEAFETGKRYSVYFAPHSKNYQRLKSLANHIKSCGLTVPAGT